MHYGASPLELVTMRTAEFAHAFLFRCPVCHGASTVVCFKSETNLETTDEKILDQNVFAAGRGRIEWLYGYAIGSLNGRWANDRIGD